MDGIQTTRGILTITSLFRQCSISLLIVTLDMPWAEHPTRRFPLLPLPLPFSSPSRCIICIYEYIGIHNARPRNNLAPNQRNSRCLGPLRRRVFPRYHVLDQKPQAILLGRLWCYQQTHLRQHDRVIHHFQFRILGCGMLSSLALVLSMR